MSETARRELVNLADLLENHEQAFRKQGGFPAGEDQVRYLGYGGSLASIGGATVHAYARGWDSGRLQIRFTMQHSPATPRLHSELGRLQLFIKSDHVGLIGQKVENPTDTGHHHPSPAELVQPLGHWLVDGAARYDARTAQNTEIQAERRELLATLGNRILEGYDLDPDALLERSIRDLDEIIRAGTAVEPGPVVVTPTPDNVAALRDFIINPSHATAGYSPTTFDRPTMRITQVYGPLLT